MSLSSFLLPACLLFAPVVAQIRAERETLILVTPTSGDTLEQQVVEFDPGSGERRIVQVYREPRTPLRASMFTKAGVPLPLKQRDGGRVSSAATRAVDAAAVLDRRAIFGLGSGTLSPSGRGLAGVLDQGLLIACDGSDHVVRTDQWFLTRPLSWSPDERHVAFYFALDDEADDHRTQQHGVAILSVDGKLRVLVPAEDSVPTPVTTAKDVPVGWSRDGKSVYFTMGLGKADPDRDPTLAERVPQTAVYRVHTETRSVEKITVGEFADIDPAGLYVLVDPTRENPRYRQQPGSFKLLLETRQKTFLPDGVRRPKISPRGDLLASLQVDQVCFCRMSNFARLRCISDPSPHQGEWVRDFRWIVQ